MELDYKGKVAYLQRYAQIKGRIEVLTERKEMYQSEIYDIKATSYSDNKVQSNTKTDLSDKVVKFMTITKDIDNELEDLARKAALIRAKIHELKNLKYISVLELKYIDGLKMYEIGSIMGIAHTQNVNSLRGLAIKVIPITEEDLQEIM